MRWGGGVVSVEGQRGEATACRLRTEVLGCHLTENEKNGEIAYFIAKQAKVDRNNVFFLVYWN
jgi:hypothetical protein